MTRWTGRLLAALGLGGRKPKGDLSQDPVGRGPGVAETNRGTAGGPQAPDPHVGLPVERRSRSPRLPVPDDVIAVLASQHEHVKKLLETVPQETGHRRASAFHTLRLTLALHETAEEQAIHPQALHQLGPNDSVATDRIAEEQTAGQTIAALELVDVDSDQFTFTFGHLATSVTDHAAAEEADEWPVLRRITDPDVIKAMIEQMRAVTQLAEDPSAPGLRATFSEMQDWAKGRLPAPPSS
jgi:hemerythrin superfamily protein